MATLTMGDQNLNFVTETEEYTILKNVTEASAAATNNTASEDASTIIKLVGYWELVVAVIGTPANLLVLYLTMRFLRRGSRRPSASTSERRHQSNLWFIFSMTLSDGLFSCVHSPMMFAQYAFGVEYNAGPCWSLYIVTYASTICSSISLLWLNADKFLYLHQPLHYSSRVTSKRAVAAVVCAWATSFVWALFFMLGPFTKTTGPCDFRPSHIYWYIAFAVGFFVMPTVISLAISVYIAYVVLRVRKANVARRKSGTVLFNGDGGTTIVGGQGASTTTSNVKAIAFVFTTTMWSAATYLPYRIAYLFYISPIFPLIRKPWSMRVSYLLFALMTMNAVGNPFITILTQRQYSVGFMQLIKRHAYSGSAYATTDGSSSYRKRSVQRTQSAQLYNNIRTTSAGNAAARCNLRRQTDGSLSNGHATSRF